MSHIPGKLLDKMADSGFYPKNEIQFYTNILDQLEHRIVPEAYPAIPLNQIIPGTAQLGMSSLIFRDDIIQHSGFALVAYEWVKPLSAWIGKRRCLEIMCGSGILSKALQSCGIEVIATDNCSYGQFEWFSQPWTKIEKIDAVEAVNKYGPATDIVICSWPFKGDTAYHVLQRMRETNPEAMMIYIGELIPDTCANKEFFDEAIFINDPEFNLAMKNFKSIYAIHDKPALLH